MTPSLVIRSERSCGYILCCSSGNVIVSQENNGNSPKTNTCFSSFMNALCRRPAETYSNPNQNINRNFEIQLQNEFGQKVSQIALSQINRTGRNSDEPLQQEEMALIQKKAEETKKMLPVLEKAFKLYRVHQLAIEEKKTEAHLTDVHLDQKRVYRHILSPQERLFILRNNKKEAFEKERIIRDLQTIALHASLDRLVEIAEEIELEVRASNKLVSTEEILKLVVKEILFKKVDIAEPPMQFPHEFSAYSKIEELPIDTIEALLQDNLFSQFRQDNSKKT